MTLKPDEKANILIEGPIGTGKTTSLITIPDCGKELFILACEPGIHTIMGDTDPEKVHWHYISPAKTDWDTLIDNAEKMNKLPMDALQKMPGMNKHEYRQFIEVLTTLANFKCDRTGEEFGAADDWGTDRVLAIDGLSGLSKMSLQLVCGAKPIKSQPEWLCAQDNLRNFLDKVTADTKCSTVLIAHTAKKENFITGGTHLTVSTIGQALAPDVPKFFDEVIFAERRADKFWWSTVEPNIDLKSRVLPLQDEIEPDFKLIFGDGE